MEGFHRRMVGRAHHWREGSIILHRIGRISDGLVGLIPILVLASCFSLVTASCRWSDRDITRDERTARAIDASIQENLDPAVRLPGITQHASVVVIGRIVNYEYVELGKPKRHPYRQFVVFLVDIEDSVTGRAPEALQVWVGGPGCLDSISA